MPGTQISAVDMVAKALNFLWLPTYVMQALVKAASLMDEQQTTIKDLETKLEALEGELQASEDGSGITNIKEQFEAQLKAIEVDNLIRTMSEVVK